MGDEGMLRLQSARVILFGIGGVGSWCAECLVRTGLRHLTIVDSDCVAPSNINRQLMATSATIGQPKTEALRLRLLEINPEAEITVRQEVYSIDTADSFNLDSYHFIIDCIDSLSDKMLLIQRATASKAIFLSSMGAALKMDPQKIKVAEFRNVKGCPLARALRQKFKKKGVFPSRKFKCVYSDELLENRISAENLSSELAFGKVRINGSLMHITAIFGLTLAGLVIEEIASHDLPSLSGPALRRISSIDSPDFLFASSLLTEAFPPEEYRPLRQWGELTAADSRFHNHVILHHDRPAGILAYWDFESFIYIEHFATLPEMRGRGLGAAMLRQLSHSTTLPIILEVEEPCGEMERRRISFYSRCGFRLLPHPYMQPPYRAGGSPLAMRLMASHTFSDEAVEKAIAIILAEVYHHHYSK